MVCSVGDLRPVLPATRSREPLASAGEFSLTEAAHRVLTETLLLRQIFGEVTDLTTRERHRRSGNPIMTFDEVLGLKCWSCFSAQGRVSYRALKRRFALDDEYLEVSEQAGASLMPNAWPLTTLAGCWSGLGASAPRPAPTPTPPASAAA